MVDLWKIYMTGELNKQNRILRETYIFSNALKIK